MTETPEIPEEAVSAGGHGLWQEEYEDTVPWAGATVSERTEYMARALAVLTAALPHLQPSEADQKALAETTFELAEADAKSLAKTAGDLGVRLGRQEALEEAEKVVAALRDAQMDLPEVMRTSTYGQLEKAVQAIRNISREGR